MSAILFLMLRQFTTKHVKSPRLCDWSSRPKQAKAPSLVWMPILTLAPSLLRPTRRSEKQEIPSWLKAVLMAVCIALQHQFSPQIKSPEILTGVPSWRKRTYISSCSVSENRVRTWLYYVIFQTFSGYFSYDINKFGSCSIGRVTFSDIHHTIFWLEFQQLGRIRKRSFLLCEIITWIKLNSNTLDLLYIFLKLRPISVLSSTRFMYASIPIFLAAKYDVLFVCTWTACFLIDSDPKYTQVEQKFFVLFMWVSHFMRSFHLSHTTKLFSLSHSNSQPKSFSQCFTVLSIASWSFPLEVMMFLTELHFKSTA